MSRWGKPTKNKRRIDPRYFLKEQQEQEGYSYDAMMTRPTMPMPSAEGPSMYSADNPRYSPRPPTPAERYDDAHSIFNPEATEWADPEPKSGLDVNDLVGVTKPYADDAAKAVARAAARRLGKKVNIPGGTGPVTDTALSYYAATKPSDPAMPEFDIFNPVDTSPALNPFSRKLADPTTPEGARALGGAGGSFIGGNIGGVLGGKVAGPGGAATGAAVGGYVGDVVGSNAGERSRQTGIGFGDLWLQRPEWAGGLTDKEYERHLNDYRQQMDQTGPYRPKTRPPGIYAAPLEETNMKKNNNTTDDNKLLTESEMKRFQNLANIKENKAVLSESLLTLAGFIGAFVGGAHLLGKIINKIERTTGTRSEYTSTWMKAGEMMHARVKEGDPQLLGLIQKVKEMTGKNILGANQDEIFAIVAEYKDDPNVADLIEALTYSRDSEELISALQRLEEYIESKEAQQPTPEQTQQPPEEPQL